MKDENIKEYIETLKEIVGDGGSKGTYGISFDHWKQLLDYITNLQTIEREYNFLLSENAELENKITNLQEENERLKQENKHIFANVNDDQLLRSNAMNWAEAQDYKTRIEKAIEYIGEPNWGEYEHFVVAIGEDNGCPSRACEELLEILKGKSDE